MGELKAAGGSTSAECATNPTASTVNGHVAESSPAVSSSKVLTPERFAELFPRVPANKQDRYRAAVVAACDRFGITTPVRLAAFLAQISHESGALRWLEEIWGPTVAQARYETRGDLGNVLPGDGYRFRGRGPLQITGRFNYAKAGQALGLPLEREPELLAEIENGMLAAAWFWARASLNALADVGEFDRICRAVNGGINGLPERVRLWHETQRVLGL